MENKMKNVILRANNVCKSFYQGSKETQILKFITTDIYEGDFTVIMGASGAGKSTLLYALSGMDSITSGEVIFKEKKISNLSEKEQATLRAKEFGFIFQQMHLVSNLTLFENIAVAGYAGEPKDIKNIQDKTMKWLCQMNIENVKNHLPSQVSGGEAQRAAIARAMINNPKLLFEDEPTGALNKTNSEDVLNLLTEFNKNGQSILMVTHDIKAAIRGNRILYLEDGKILDELHLISYQEDYVKKRETKVNDWLTALQW